MTDCAFKRENECHTLEEYCTIVQYSFFLEEDHRWDKAGHFSMIQWLRKKQKCLRK